MGNCCSRPKKGQKDEDAYELKGPQHPPSRAQPTVAPTVDEVRSLVVQTAVRIASEEKIKETQVQQPKAVKSDQRAEKHVKKTKVVVKLVVAAQTHAELTPAEPTTARAPSPLKTEPTQRGVADGTTVTSTTWSKSKWDTVVPQDLDEAPEDDASSSDYETAPSRRSL